MRNYGKMKSNPMEALSELSLLGRYPVRDGYVTLEFQIGIRLIWVKCRPDQVERECLSRAEEIYRAVNADIPSVIELAEETSRALIPSFWEVHDKSKITGSRLDVWGVTLNPEDGSASYEVSRNHDFDFDVSIFEPDDVLEEQPLQLPDVPENHFVIVDRNSSGLLHVRGTYLSNQH
jgi:hypothetical protein